MYKRLVVVPFRNHKSFPVQILSIPLMDQIPPDSRSSTMATDFYLFLITLSVGFLVVALFSLLRCRILTQPKLEETTSPPLPALKSPAPQFPQAQYSAMQPPFAPSSVPMLPPPPPPPLPYGTLPYQTQPQPGLSPMPPSVLIKGAYQILHQRWNKPTHSWIFFNPSPPTQTFLEEALFIVYYRYESPGAGGSIRKVVEIRSPSLRTVLKGCLKSVEFVENAYQALPSQYVGLGNYPQGIGYPPQREAPLSFEQNPQV